MFELQFTNGIPAKDFKFVACCQNFENNEELQDYFKEEGIEKGIKIFLLDEADVKNTSGNYKGVHVTDNKLWFDYGDKYLIVDGLEEDTKKYFLAGNRKYIIASINSKNNAVNLIAQYTIV